MFNAFIYVVIQRQQWTSPPPVAYILSTSTVK